MTAMKEVKITITHNSPAGGWGDGRQTRARLERLSVNDVKGAPTNGNHVFRMPICLEVSSGTI